MRSKKHIRKNKIHLQEHYTTYNYAIISHFHFLSQKRQKAITSTSNLQITQN